MMPPTVKAIMPETKSFPGKASIKNIVNPTINSNLAMSNRSMIDRIFLKPYSNAEAYAKILKNRLIS